LSELVTYLLFFFFMLPPPPRSTLFLYTTLFRSRGTQQRACGHRGNSDHLPAADYEVNHPRNPVSEALSAPIRQIVQIAEAKLLRSEEHTSELQSLRHLVCRLLLEKKKKKKIKKT